MKLRLSSNTWVLLILAIVIFVVGAEAARNYVLGGKDAVDQVAQQQQAYAPEFKVGDAAPNFSLKDRRDQPHSLSSLVKRDTLLCFLCGCANCRNMQNYVGRLLKTMGSKAPSVVSVTTTDPAAEAAYRREVALPQTILYEEKDDPAKHSPSPADTLKVGDIYKGHPCPRIFRLTPQVKVAWIGPSPGQLPGPGPAYQAVAEELGFRYPGAQAKDPKAPLAPAPSPQEIMPSAMPGAIGPPPAAIGPPPAAKS